MTNLASSICNLVILNHQSNLSHYFLVTQSNGEFFGGTIFFNLLNLFEFFLHDLGGLLV
jgi:hypothetical protein